jgi:hypothetical protein
MRYRSIGTLAAVVVAVAGVPTPAAASPGAGATVERMQDCETFQDPDTGSEITYCEDVRMISKETITGAGVTVALLVLDSSFSFTQNGIVVNTGNERRRATWVAREGATKVLTFTSDSESFFFGTLCTTEVRVQVVGGRVVFDEEEIVCVVV